MEWFDQSLEFLALAETWITPENTATPAALLSSDYVFSLSPRASVSCIGGSDLLIFSQWRFSIFSLTHLIIS